MLYLYLDESGDLGFDFAHKIPSKYFTIMIMSVSGDKNRKHIAKAVKRTLKNKLNGAVNELKGSKQSLKIKKYFYSHIKATPFELYALTLNKSMAYNYRIKNKDRVYNFIIRRLLDVIPFTDASTRINLIIDRSKSKEGISEFNKYIVSQLSGKLEPKIPLNIDHHLSHEDLPLQAVDLFSWGVFQKYENNKMEWFDTFKDKIKYDDIYLL